MISLAMAINLHEKHMNGTVKPTMESQAKMMEYLKIAMAELRE